MAITKIATVQTANAGGADASIVVPAGVTTAHLGVLAIVMADNGGATQSVTGWTSRINAVHGSSGTMYLFTRLGGVAAGQTVTITLTGAVTATTTAVWYDTQGRDIAYASAEWDTAAADSTTARWNPPGHPGTADVILAAPTRTTSSNTLPAPAGATLDFYGVDASGVDGAFFGHATSVASQTYTASWSPGGATSHNTATMQFAIAAPVTSGSGTLTQTGSGALALTGTPRGTGIVALAASGALTATPVVTYYVSPTGSDTADGLTPATAWASITKANTSLTAGATVLFARGGTWTGATLTLATDRLTLGAYGTGAAPLFDGRNALACCVKVTGNYVTVQDVAVTRGGLLTGNGMGAQGVLVYGTDALVQRVEAYGSYVGITFADGAHRGKALNCNVHDNTQLYIGPGTTDDAYANGFGLFAADSLEIAYNTITGHHAPSPDFGTDGSAIEVYGATNASVHHNRADDNNTFSELGRVGTANNTFYDNVISSAASGSYGLTVQGTDGEGPATGTRWLNNTVVLTGSSTVGFYIGAGTDVHLRNNIWVAAQIASIESGVTWDEGNSVYAGDISALPGWAASSTVVANLAAVGFVNAATGNYRLAAGSPAIDRGAAVSFTSDYEGNSRVVGAAPDAGAYESGAGTFLTGSLTPSASGVLTWTPTVALTGALTRTSSGGAVLTALPQVYGAVDASGAGGLDIDGRMVRIVFEGPTILEVRPLRAEYPRSLLTQTLIYGQTVWRDAQGAWHQKYAPGASEIEGATRVYSGGRRYQLDDVQRTELIAAGYGAFITEESL